MRLLGVALIALLQLPEAALTGVVVRAGTDLPVARARVLIVPQQRGAEGVRIAISDERGRFQVAMLADGVYRAWAEQEQYVRSSPIAVRIAAGAAAGPLTIAMVPTAVITGRVVDPNAEPVADVDVRAENDEGVWEGRTNDLGEYRLFGLPPGTYVVSAAPYLPPRIENAIYVRPTPPSPFSRGEGQFMIPLSRMLEAGDFVDPRALAGAGQVRVFYPGTRDADTAVELEVRPGETTAGIDLVIE